MKTIASIYITFFILSNASFSQSEIWVNTSDGYGDQTSCSLIKEHNGNLYMFGSFKSNTCTLGNFDLVNKGVQSSDIFLACLNKNGELDWATSIGGSMEDEPREISIDHSGNIFIRGHITSNDISFGETIVKGINPGTDYSFLGKYNSNGKLLWVKTFKAEGVDQFVDNFGNIYLTGRALRKQKFHFDNIRIELPEDGMFVVKMDPYGKVMWLKKGIGSTPFNISGDENENLFVTGMISGPEFYFESGSRVKHSLVKEGDKDAFILKLNREGNVQWQRLITGKGDEEIKNTLLTKTGTLLVLVKYTSLKLKIGNHVERNGVGDNLIIANFDSDGAVGWVRNCYGIDNNHELFLNTDKDNNVFLTGHLFKDGISIDEDKHSNIRKNDIFLLKFSSSGNILWLVTTGGNEYDYPTGLITDDSNNILIFGEFNRNSIALNGPEYFIEKYNPEGAKIWNTSNKETNSFHLTPGAELDKRGNLYMIGYSEKEQEEAGLKKPHKREKDLFILRYDFTE